MRQISFSFCLLCCLAFSVARGQTEWPRTLPAPDGSVLKIYEPQPDSFRNNVLQFRSAFSLLEKGKTAPEFGMFQAIATVETDRDDRSVSLVSVKIPVLRFPDSPAAARITTLKATFEAGIPGLNIVIPLDELLSSLDMNTEEKKLSLGLNNEAPRIIFATKPSLLVVIDGEPRIQMNKDLGVEAVVNTPYTILKHDNSWYLYGGRHWYFALSPMGPFSHSSTVPGDLQKVQAAIDNADSAEGSHTDTAREGADIVADIIVSTVPAELIQSKGDPLYSAIEGTGLLYISNSNNDIFVDTKGQQFFVLLSGRWFRSPALENGEWKYIPSDSLPTDFARIQEGSPKDKVLASVAGTAAAREALVDAQIPQTARIERKSATVQVSYDGDPKFADIRGTHLQYALNTQATVIRDRNHFYCVDNGVWFSSGSPFGPWAACTVRPEEVDLIPPDCPVYDIKYVYIYDVTPDFVYMGYTPGYLDNFIYGPTVVYGTGFYYQPWWGSFYYPRPWTWGFNMWYNPWYGWCFGYDFGLDWFNLGIGWGWGFWPGGWWGPRIYRPPYVWHHFRGHGLYERDIRRVENIDHNNNLYRFRKDMPGRPESDHIFTDKSGNIFRRDGQGNWQQRDSRQWKNLNSRPSPTIQNLNRQQQGRERGQMRIQNFQQQRGGVPAGGSPRPIPGGMARPGRRAG